MHCLFCNETLDETHAPVFVVCSKCEEQGAACQDCLRGGREHTCKKRKVASTAARKTRSSAPPLSLSLSAGDSVGSVDYRLLHASVGFEWDCSDCLLNGGLVASKVVILEGEWGVKVESDDGHTEIITAPILCSATKRITLTGVVGDDWRVALTCQVQAFNDLRSKTHDLVRAASYGANLVTLPIQKPQFSEWSHERVALTGTGPNNGRMQATIGVPLARILELADQATTWQGLKSWIDNQSVRTALQEVRNLPDCTLSLRGFVLLVKLYIYWLSDNGGDDQGPKSALPLMCRTNFRDAYESLREDEKGKFADWVRESHALLNEKVLMPEGYLLGVNKKLGVKPCYCPTAYEWVYSIVDPGRAWDSYYERVQQVEDWGHLTADLTGALVRRTTHDLLSPPPFFYAHGTDGLPFTYAMGLYPMVDGLILLELRDFGGVEHHQVGDTMLKFCQFAFEAKTE